MASFEVVDFIPSYEHKSKNRELFNELIEKLKDLKEKKSVRKPAPDLKAAVSLMHGARAFFKKQNVDEVYFATVRKDEEDGTVYTYFGKRDKTKN